ncbi:flavin monoamine oxidase family protein [Pararhizobium sp. DWP1-1-3]|uniref:flavin monoamine oxidase family protein n=1 Tax=Pararhizobium sp. DWP1-1-3 TaxID=2804652 RepID=UPI003CE7DBE2
MSGYDADVIVAGAGFTGLSAADALVSAGLDVIVLEACDRVGGRVERTAFADGVAMDTGGQFVCDEMPNVTALARRFGLRLAETPLDGEFVFRPQASANPEAVFAETDRIHARAEGMDPRDPKIAGLTAGEWLARQNDPPDAKAGYQAMVEGLWCRPAGEIPLWYLIDNDRRTTSDGNELQYFVEGTIHAAAEALAATLGQRLRLGTPVVRITRAGDSVSVRTGNGDVLTARQVIIAVPPVMASRIVHEPGLPASLAGALGAWKSGTVIKALVRLERPFWRDRGLSGMILWRDTLGLFACDVSSAQATALVVFAGGPLAVEWSAKGRAFIEAEIRRRLVEALGEAAAGVTGLLIRDWVGDPWSGGGYSDVITDLQAYDAEDILRAGAPPVHFASSELASSFPAYIEGAIVAGREAAVRVIAAHQSAIATSASGS